MLLFYIFYFNSMKSGHRFYLHLGYTLLLTFNGEGSGSVRLAFGLDGLKGHLQLQSFSKSII